MLLLDGDMSIILRGALLLGGEGRPPTRSSSSTPLPQCSASDACPAAESASCSPKPQIMHVYACVRRFGPESYSHEYVQCRFRRFNVSVSIKAFRAPSLRRRTRNSVVRLRERAWAHQTRRPPGAGFSPGDLKKGGGSDKWPSVGLLLPRRERQQQRCHTADDSRMDGSPPRSGQGFPPRLLALARRGDERCSPDQR